MATSGRAVAGTAPRSGDRRLEPRRTAKESSGHVRGGPAAKDGLRHGGAGKAASSAVPPEFHAEPVRDEAAPSGGADAYGAAAGLTSTVTLTRRSDAYGAAAGLTSTVTLTGVTKTVSSATACST